MKFNLLILGTIVLVGGLLLGFYFYNNANKNPQYTPVTLPGFKSPSAQEATPIEDRRTTKGLVLLDVPFTAQAPFGDWDDPRQQAGCEEAVALMAMRWVQGRSLTLAEAEKEIIAISDFELKNYGHFHDTSAADTVSRIFKGYFKYNNIELKYDIQKEDIINELSKGNLVLVLANGQKLDNPYYNPPGPLEHALVIRGYDPKTKEFITNDSGTKRGESFRYPDHIVMNAINDYPTGLHEPINEIRKIMIVVKKT